ncbi:Glutamine--fructose-6-phosphate aminotransferase [isomerizing] [Microbacterium sp. MM2322]|uniref:glutamine--fructose-6-phosphate transaminase (isomerizing) n=1 Tax=Microbacterium sp. MM2322 TaxID=3157631 RepID=UPI003D807065
MCGIAASVGRRGAASRVKAALERLEYRGYDSAGIAARSADGGVAYARTVGGVASLGTAPDDPTTAAIGHTRWATHGGVTERNAHPLRDCTGRLFIAHNGIIENADILRTELVAAGHRLTSDVDSEVIVHLLEDALITAVSLPAALFAAAERLRGSWAVVALDTLTGEIAATAHGSPLIAAEAADGVYVASDVGAVADRVTEFRVIDDDDVVVLDSAGIRWWGAGQSAPTPAARTVPRSHRSPVAGRHSDHMGNEIDEQPAVARSIVDSLAPRIAEGALWNDLALPPIETFERVVILGCGTSLHAGRAVGGVFSKLGRLPSRALVASECADAVWEPRTLVIALSQSGETADVLRAFEALPRTGITVLALTNNPMSTLARRADAVIDCLAGPEIGVAATKTFLAQVLTGVCVALSGLSTSPRLAPRVFAAQQRALHHAPAAIERALRVWGDIVPGLTNRFAEAPGFLFLGRGGGVVYAAEGALKLKELTYRWAEHQPAGELKHGPLALVGQGTPVFVVDDGDPRLDVSIAEVEARGGHVVRVSGPGPQTSPSRPSTSDALLLPAWGPLDAVVPLQMFARALALHLGHNVDRPRNLAKSVTVQ